MQTSTDNFARSAADIQNWMAEYIADLLGVESEEVDPELSFDRFGLDSAAAIGMTGALEDWLGTEIDPTLVYDYPSIKAMADHLGK